MDKRYAKPCIFYCDKARKESGSWSCPVFERGLEHVSIETEDGSRCRKFTRRKDG